MNKYIKYIASIALTIGLSYSILYAVSVLEVNSGDTLSSTTWNTLVNKIDGINTDVNGNVGIGTTTPGFKLDVSSNSDNQLRISTTDYPNGVAKMSFSTPAYNGLTITERAFISYNDAGTGWNGSLVFNVGGSVASEKMRIDYVGNVGIGTDSPGSKLSVVGLPSGTTDAVVSGTLAGAVCIDNLGNMYIDTDGNCSN